MRRFILASCAVLAVGCGGAAPIELHERLDVDDLPPVDVHVRVQPEHRRDADRYLHAAVATLRTCEEWLGPFPHPSLTVIDPGRQASTTSAGDAVVLERTPWWSTPHALTAEMVTARGVSRRYWSDLFQAGARPPPIVDALAEYTARRAVVSLFGELNNPPGYAFLEARYFGGLVPRFVRVRRLPETDGASNALLALGTLERWLSRPVFDQAVAEFVRSSRGAAPTLDDFERVASNVSGQNLSWFFDQTLRSTAPIDYGIARLTSERQPDGSYLTTVVARRYGDGVFTGTSAPRFGSFESGRGLTLRMTFADGPPISDRWDGRDREKIFSYRSPAAAVSAEIDPDRLVLLDLRRTNNSRTLASHGAGAATRWAGRWMIWMQDLVLTYASLV
jgi:hypothetical protein